MRGIRPVRSIAVAAAVASAAALGAVAYATPASAKPRVVVTCSHLNVPAPKNNVAKGSVTGCTVPKATGGQGQFMSTVGSGTATIKWNKTGTTTMTYTVSPATKPDEKETQGCPTHTTELVVSGSVTGGTGAAGKLIPAGSPVSAEVCVSAKGVTTNEPGNKMNI